MYQPLVDLLRECVEKTPEGTTFTLYVKGTRHDQSLTLTGYCIPSIPRRIKFDHPSKMMYFTRAEMQNAMKEIGFDFSCGPVAQGSTMNFNWLMTPSSSPDHFNGLRDVSDRAKEKRRLENVFEQFSNFEQAYPDR